MLTQLAVPEPVVLVVDLDGTLLRGDMLHESFWSAFGQDWRVPVLSGVALLKGRAALKRYLAMISMADPATLPYDDRVIAFVGKWRQAGGRTALVTASDQQLADAIAAELGLFDEVHGSDGVENLKGDRKARFLVSHFGAQGYAYMGDSAADLPVWRQSAKAITVNASKALRREVEQSCDNVEHLESESRRSGAYLSALRAHQWLKNSFVFLPVLAAQQFDLGTLMLTLAAFICFSVVASGVYLLNDLLDLAADRAHPRKRDRPFASGRVPVAHGWWMIAGLISAGTALAASIGPGFLSVMATYFILTTAYSLYFKRHAVIDICVLAGLYTLRIVAGGVATGIPLSVWLLTFSVFFFLSLAAVKRQVELVDGTGRGKAEAKGRGYVVDDLPIVAMVAIGAGYVSVLVMALYVNSPDVTANFATPEALWGVCSVLLYWVTRTVLVAHRGQMHDDPVIFAAKDRVSQICLLVILGFVTAGAVA